VDELIASCMGLADFPRRFRRAPRYGPNAHRRSHGDYVILYDVVGEEVRILTIVHAARDIDALLG
jgi:plasmid stabilization system protein ParE